MVTRWLLILLICCTSCMSGLIPCPTVKADKVKKSNGRSGYFAPKMMTASAKETKSVKETKQTETVKRSRPEARPALEHVNVEEWDCPKPGGKKNMPKALKENIRKNKKAFEAYYKNRSVADSLSARSVDK
jgi:hypothetical protein